MTDQPTVLLKSVELELSGRWTATFTWTPIALRWPGKERSPAYEPPSEAELQVITEDALRVLHRSVGEPVTIVKERDGDRWRTRVETQHGTVRL